MLRFEGSFESDWTDTDKWVRDRDPDYDRACLLDPAGLGEQPFRLDELREVDKEDLKSYGRQQYLRYFPKDLKSYGRQLAGAPMPDLAAAHYTLPGGTLRHLKSGNAFYADGSMYSGTFENGRPQGEGVLRQPEPGEDPSKDGGPAYASTYTGQWQKGARGGPVEGKGIGVLEIQDGSKYTGGWRFDKRHGEGEQTLPPGLEALHGYTFYKGSWKDGLRHGPWHKGFYLDFSSGEHSYRFEGQFEAGARKGPGKLFLKKDGGALTPEEDIIFSGGWSDDGFVATKESPAWARFPGDGGTFSGFYYGALTADGQRVGMGTQYVDDAKYDAEFMEAFIHGKEFKKERPDTGVGLKYTRYHGRWRANMPDGEGLQHFDGKGTYRGQFLRGRRDGRGEWAVADGSWKYKPTAAKSDVGNWRADKMHGIACVETREHVHQQVAFVDGDCEMPFTDKGPPATGFDDNILVGGVERAVGAVSAGVGSLLHGGRTGKVIPPCDWTPADAEGARLGAAALAGGRRRGQLSSALALDAAALSPALVPASASSALAPSSSAPSRGLVRCSTRLEFPEQDVYVTGGTGENALLNGLYYKLPSTFGESVFRLAKRDRQIRGPGSLVSRFLFRHEGHSGIGWALSTQIGELIRGPGCAYSLDSAEHPSDIKEGWHVWHPQVRGFVLHGTEDQFPEEPDGQLAALGLSKSTKPLQLANRLRTQGVLGFHISGAPPPLLEAGVTRDLLVRRALAIYGRPVYESESGGLYLYWLREGGSFEVGLEAEQLTQDGLPSQLLLSPDSSEVSGHWAIARKVGAALDSSDCLAYVRSNVPSPDQIRPAPGWLARLRREPSSPLAECPRLRVDMDLSMPGNPGAPVMLGLPDESGDIESLHSSRSDLSEDKRWSEESRPLINEGDDFLQRAIGCDLLSRAWPGRAPQAALPAAAPMSSKRLPNVRGGSA